jgi:hypothetical protein
VTKIQGAKMGTVSVSKTSCLRYDQVLIGNEVFVLGYPAALGIRQEPKQFDLERPLLRKGIVAGKFDSLRTIILDCPAYYGNSGSPVLQVERDFAVIRFRVIGIVIEFIPFDERFVNAQFGFKQQFWSNSGYSVAAPIEHVFQLLSLKHQGAP